MTTWQKYVRAVTDGATQTAIGEHSGIAQSTIGRWLNGKKAPTEAGKVAAFAQAYGRNVLEAFVAAGMLDIETAGGGLDAKSRRFLAELSGERPTLRSVAKKGAIQPPKGE